MIARTTAHAPSVAQFASDVQYYLLLRPRQLPSRYFYDDLGSALFEAICALPWYGITRAELRLLTAHGSEILASVPDLTSIVELGPGSGVKLAALVGGGRPGTRRIDLHLVDISSSALEVSSRALATLPGVHITTYEAPYEVGLLAATAETRAGRALVLLLGSNIGNFDRPGADAFLRGVRACLARGDMLLLGADLVKPARTLVLAYDDPLGVTAAFNRNLLVRINRELGADFDIDRFAHRAAWVGAQSRVEMHLVSLARQRVRVRAAEVDLTLEEGESIWTESSYKYRPDEVLRILEQAGFGRVGQWIDEQDAFSVSLVEAL